MTEEELEELEEFEDIDDVIEEEAKQEPTELPLDQLQIQILRELLKGGDALEIIKANHLMPSIAADFINEALFDEIGDSVLIYENNQLSLAEDYIEELTQLLGGTGHGRT